MPTESPGAYTILSEESEAAYHITEQFAGLGSITKAAGVSSMVEGEIWLDLGSHPVVQSVTVAVDLRGLESDDPKRDEKLAGRWLVTNRFPMATFVSTGIEASQDSFQEGEEVSFRMEGDLTIRDVTRPVTFQVQARLVGTRLEGQASAAILMSDFGIDPPNLLGFVRVEDVVELTVGIIAQAEVK
jgi:polyisoprenoid-binding protein YceI